MAVRASRISSHVGRVGHASTFDALTDESLSKQPELLATMLSGLSPEKQARLTDPFVKAKVARDVASKYLRGSAYAVDAATIVFSHGALDALVLKLIRVCAVANPASLEPFVIERQVRLADMKTMDYPRVLETMIASECKRLEGESLPMKTGRLIALIRPEPGTLPDGYSQNWLERFDERRHQLVHRSKVSLDDLDVSAEFDRVGSVGDTLTKSVSARYQLTFDYNTFMSAIS